MTDDQIVIYLLGLSEVEKHKKDIAINDLCDKYNNLLEMNKDLLKENELANKDAKQQRDKVEQLIQRCAEGVI